MAKFKFSITGVTYEGKFPFTDPIKFGLGIAIGGGMSYFTYKGIKYGYDNWLPVKQGIKKSLTISASEEVNNLPSDDTNPETNTIKLAPSERLYDMVNGTQVQVQPVQLLGEYLLAGSSMLIYCGDGMGKSFLSVQLGMDMATGRTSQIFSPDDNVVPSTPVQVFVYDAENRRDKIIERYKKLGQEIPQNIEFIRTTFDTVEALIRDIEIRTLPSYLPVVIIIDNLSSIMPRLSEEDARTLMTAQITINGEMEKRGLFTSFIVVGHSTKGSNDKSNQNFRGTGKIGDLTEVRITLQKTRYGDDVVMMIVEKNRHYPKPKQVTLLKRIEDPFLHYVFNGRCSKEEAAPIDGRTSCSFDTDDTETDVFKMSKAQLKKMEMIEEARQINELMLEGILNKKELSVRLGKDKNYYKTVERRIKDFHLPDPDFNSKH